MFIAKDIPFLHCTLRMSRNYEPYIYRIILPLFLIMINTTLVFEFASGSLSDRLTYVVTNMLTIVAFFFIVSSLLPQIPYLTFMDKYMNGALVYVTLVGIVTVINSVYNIEQTETEQDIFYVCLAFLGCSHAVLALYCWYIRHIEYNKVHINRHESKILDEHRWNNTLCGAVEASAEEFLVHTYISQVDEQNEDINGNTRQTYTGTLRKYFKPAEAAGWLFDGDNGRIEMRESKKDRISKDRVKAIKKSIKTSRDNAVAIKKKTIEIASNAAKNAMNKTVETFNNVKSVIHSSSNLNLNNNNGSFKEIPSETMKTGTTSMKPSYKVHPSDSSKYLESNRDEKDGD